MANLLLKPPTGLDVRKDERRLDQMVAPPKAKPVDYAEAAYPAGTYSAAPGNSLRAASGAAPASNPFSAPKGQPRNALLAGALDGFQRGFDPAGFEKREAQNKADGLDKQKQTLALMQQQRQIPVEQRTQWWQQNADTIGQITGQDVRSMPLDPSQFTDQALDGHIAALSAQLGIGPEKAEPIKYQSVNLGNAGVGSFNPSTGEMEVLREPSEDKDDGPDIRQVGNQILERQEDGSWKSVYTGSSPAETARAFQGFIDDATGEQMLVMSDGSVKGTGRTAYVPPQITSIGGVPSAVDKRTYETTELAPLETAAGNRAAMSSAEVQGRSQGEAAFNLPTIEMRSQAAINSIRDLKGRNIGTRFGMQGKLYAIPGTEGADVQALIGQVTSQAFLNAFDQLRGAGAITEREGQAATAAITRLQNQNITIGEAIKAMDELDQYYRKGLDVARQKAVKAPVLPERPAASAGAPRGEVPFLLAKPQNTAAGVPDGVDPEDWKYMTDEQKALFQ